MRPTAGDAFLLAHTPVVVVPRFGVFEPLLTNGHRFLVCQDGLWIEVRRDWCHIVWPIAEQHAVPTPFGLVERHAALSFGDIPRWCLDRFIEDARHAHPVETGAVVLWDADTKSLQYERVEELQAGVGHLRAKWPATTERRTVAIDLHSHGPLEAYFSATDLQDTGSEVVIAVVVGRLDLPQPEVKLALFFCGMQIDVSGFLGLA